MLNKKSFIFHQSAYLLLFLLLLSYSVGWSQQEKDTTKLMNVSYGKKGVELRTRDNKFLFQIQSRFQFRFFIIQRLHY